MAACGGEGEAEGEGIGVAIVFGDVRGADGVSAFDCGKVEGAGGL